MKFSRAIIVLSIFSCFLISSTLFAAPAAPVMSVSVNGNTVTISWSSVFNASGYVLYYAPYPSASPIDYIELGSTLTVSADLPNGSAYYIAITAYDSNDDESEPSNIESFIVGSTSPPVVDQGDTGGGGGNSTAFGFSYIDRGPGLGSDWDLDEAKKTDTGVWALYENSSTDESKLTRYDWLSKTWQTLDFEFNIKDFDVPRTNDLGDYAIVTYFDEDRREDRLIDIQGFESDVDLIIANSSFREVALHWGDGPVKHDTWLGETGPNGTLWNIDRICCPQGWDRTAAIPGASFINDIVASHRNGGYVLVASDYQLALQYLEGGNVLDLSDRGVFAAGFGITFDVSTEIAYVLRGGGFYRIIDLPNSLAGTSELVADLSQYFTTGLNSYFGIDVEHGTMFGPYGLMVDLNGNVSGSWMGAVALTDIAAVNVAILASQSRFIFKNPNSNTLLINIKGVDSNTFELIDNWVEVDVAGVTPYKNALSP